MTTVAALLCLLIASSLTQADRVRRSASLEMSVNPSDAVESETQKVEIKCRPPASLSGVYQGIFLVIAHTDDQGGVRGIVQQQTTGTIVMATGNITERLTAEGNARSAERNETSFLNLALSNPQASDSGVYSCKFIYLDTSMNVQQMDAAVTLSVQQPNATEVLEILPVPVIVEPVEVFQVEEVEEVCNCSTIKEEIDELRDSLLIENAELKSRLAQVPVVAPVLPAGDASCQVSFSARLSVRGIPIVDGSTIPFNTAISNKGDAFNTGSNVFTAPCDGQYYFSLTLRSYQYMDSGSVEAAIVKGGQSQVRTNVFIDHNRNHYESAGVTAVLDLSAGQEVKVMMTSTSSGQVLGEEYTVFSGFYLF